MVQKNGVMIVALGYEHVIRAVQTAISVRKIHSDLGICLVTNIEINKDTQAGHHKIFDEVILVKDHAENNRLYKIGVCDLSPFERTLYLDTDTILMGDISYGFKMLDQFDLAIRLHHYPVDYNGRFDIHIGIPIQHFSHWNSGVFFFKKSPEASEFFKDWKTNFLKFNYPMDQPSLAHTIYSNKARVLSLDISWNCGQKALKIDKRIGKYLKVLHYRLSLPIAKNLFKINNNYFEKLLTDPKLHVDDFQKFKNKYNPFLYTLRKIKGTLIPKFK